jgi:hypothetical protein
MGEVKPGGLLFLIPTLTFFRWDDKLRSSVCTHSEHQAHTIKDPAVSLRKSQDCANMHKPACIKVLKRENRNDAPMTSLNSGCDTFWEQAKTSAKRHEHLIEWICALLKVFNQCSMNQPWIKCEAYILCSQRCLRQLIVSGGGGGGGVGHPVWELGGLWYRTGESTEHCVHM